MNKTHWLLTTAAAAASLTVAMPAHADGMHWSGDVDDTAHISIHKSDVRIDANDKGIRHERHSIHGGLHRGVFNVTLKHFRGRGEVRIVQQPNRNNHFTAVVVIRDPQAGASHYEFDLQW
jgi:hypothetical protein